MDTINNLEAFEYQTRHTRIKSNGGHKRQGSQVTNKSIENSAILLKEQLERYKEALGDTLDQRINSIVSPINTVGQNFIAPKHNLANTFGSSNS